MKKKTAHLFLGLLIVSLHGCNKESTPVPTITGFSPSSGSVGTVVSITGTNFSSNPSNNVVKFNDAIALVSSATSSTITATVPSGATSGPLSVITNGHLSESSSYFTVVKQSISGFEPQVGTIGTVVTITGDNFDAIPEKNVVKFNGTVANVTNSTTTSITAIVPPGTTTGPITITIDGMTATSSSNFYLLTITQLDISQGPEGSLVTISGTSFSSTPKNNLVKFNGTIAPVINASATELTVVVTTGTTSGPVTVTIDGSTATSPIDFKVTGVRLSPTSGPAGTFVIANGGSSGDKFDPNSWNDMISFPFASSIVPSTATSTQMTFYVPPSLLVSNFTGIVDIKVDGVLIKDSPSFTYAPYSIEGITPINGPAGTRVTMTGTGFDPNPANNYISFGNVNNIIHPFTASETQLTFAIPDGMTGHPTIMLSTDGEVYATGPIFVITTY